MNMTIIIPNFTILMAKSPFSKEKILSFILGFIIMRDKFLGLDEKFLICITMFEIQKHIGLEVTEAYLFHNIKYIT